MPTKAPIVASAITFILLVVISLFFGIVQLLALDGAISEQRAMLGLGVSMLSQLMGYILCAIFAARLTRRALTKFQWGKVGSVLFGVVIGTITGVGVAFVSLILGVVVAGIG